MSVTYPTDVNYPINVTDVQPGTASDFRTTLNTDLNNLGDHIWVLDRKVIGGSKVFIGNVNQLVTAASNVETPIALGDIWIEP